MRALALHVPDDRTTPQRRAIGWRTSCNERVGRPSWSVNSAVPTTTPQQHVVDAGVECIIDGWLIPPPVRPSQPTARSYHVSVAEQETAAKSTRDGYSQGQPHSTTTVNFSSAAAGDVAQTEPQQDQEQQSGLHILRQYVPSPANILHDQLQQRQQAVHQDTSLGCNSEEGKEEESTVDAGKQYQKSVVRSLRTCSNIQQLSGILQQHGDGMDFMSITSCFTAAARLVAQQQHAAPPQVERTAAAGQQAPNQQLQSQHNGYSQHMQQRSAEPGELQHQHRALPSTEFKQLHHQTHSSRSSSSCQVEHYQDLLQQQLVPLLQAKLQRSADATGLVLVLYSLAVMKYTTDQRLLLDLEHAVIPLIPQLTPRLLSQLLWCLCSLYMQPQQQLMSGLILYSGRKIHAANAQDCAQLIQGLARMQQQPPEQWMDLLYSRVFQLLQTDQVTPHSLSIIMYNLGKLQLQPPAPLLLSLQTASQQALSQLPPAGIVMLGQSLHLLHIKQPSSSWQYSYMQAVGNVLPDCTARELAVLTVPLLKWRCVLPEQWMQQYLEACEGCLSQMTAQGLAILGHSLSGLRVMPSEQWLQGYLSAAQQQQLATTPAGCSYLMCTLGAWRALQAVGLQQQGTVITAGAPASSSSSGSSTYLMEVLAADCVQCFMQDGSSFTAEQVGMFCKGLAMMRVQGQQQLSNKLQQVIMMLLKPQRKQQKLPHQQQQQATAATLVSILLALAVSCPAAATPKVLSDMWPALQRQMHKVTPGQAAAVTWALSKLSKAAHESAGVSRGDSSLQPPRAVVDSLLQQVAVEVETASPRDITVLLLGVRKKGWGVEPGRVQVLVRELLKKQALLLQQQQHDDDTSMASSALDRAGRGSCQHQHYAGAFAAAADSEACPGTDDSYGNDTHSLDTAHSSTVISRDHSSSSSNSRNGASYRVYGLANHRLKGLLAATSAAAAWAHVLSPKARAAALQLCQGTLEQYGLTQLTWPSEDCSMVSYMDGRTMDQQVLAVLATDVVLLITAAERQSAEQDVQLSSRSQQQQQQQQQDQWVQVPQGLALLLWKQRAAYWPQLSRRQQCVLLAYWERCGLSVNGSH